MKAPGKVPIELRSSPIKIEEKLEKCLENHDSLEYKIESAHETDNVVCHDLIHYFGFPRDNSSYEFDCKLCDKLRRGTYEHKLDGIASSSDDEDDEEEAKESEEDDKPTKRKQEGKEEQSSKRRRNK